MALSFLRTFVGTVWYRHRDVLAAIVVLRFRWRRREAADARLGRRAHRRHAVSVVIGSRGHLVRRTVGDEALGDLELGVLKMLFQLGVFVGASQFLVRGGRALR